jgi:hypothetical protein
MHSIFHEHKSIFDQSADESRCLTYSSVDFGCSLLHHAVQDGSTDLIQKILQKRGDLIKESSLFGLPLEVAIEHKTSKFLTVVLA